MGIQYNANLQAYVASQGQSNIIDPTGDYTNRWIHKVTLPDSDGDGVLDAFDNCPYAYNPGQENFDADGPPIGNGPGIGNGRGIPGHDATVPNGDGWGDACDSDDDNDGLPDGSDSDPRGDLTYDDNNNGVSCLLGVGGRDLADDGPSWDRDCNGIRDGVTCTASATADSDGDGLKDRWEQCKWGTNPNDVHTDADSPGDCREAADVDGNRVLDFVGDALNYARAALIPGWGEDGDFDINGDTSVDFVADAITVAKFVEVPGVCQ